MVFGIMNEPHDIPDITAWATTVQAAVTAIRQAGAKSQRILLPGNDCTSERYQASLFEARTDASLLWQILELTISSPTARELRFSKSLVSRTVVTSEAADELTICLSLTDIDGTTTNLIFDVHQYLDSDDSGTSSTCQYLSYLDERCDTS